MSLGRQGSLRSTGAMVLVDDLRVSDKSLAVTDLSEACRRTVLWTVWWLGVGLLIQVCVLWVR